MAIYMSISYYLKMSTTQMFQSKDTEWQTGFKIKKKRAYNMLPLGDPLRAKETHRLKVRDRKGI